MNLSPVTNLLLAVFLSFILTACGSDKSKADSAETTDISHLSDEEQLKIRIKQRWDALIVLDMATVYSLATPSYRATYDLNHLIRQYGGQIKRTGIDITSIDIDDGGSTARTLVQVHTQVQGFEGGAPMDISVNSKGTWVKRAGQWWYVEPR